MAPTKGSKRASIAPAAPPSPKKARNELAGIIEILEDAEELNEHCRDMLTIMARQSLPKAKADRHDMQNVGVTMIEETLEFHKNKLIEAAEKAEKELSDLEGSRHNLSLCMQRAKDALSEKHVAKTAASVAHEEAKAAAATADTARKDALKQQEKVEEAHSTLQKEKTDIDTVYKEHFVAPMEVNEGPRHNFLKPFLAKLSLEEALVQAAPSSCVKTKEQRGGFDDLVISELGKAFVTRIETLEKSIVDGTATIAELRKSTETAERQLEEMNLAEKTAAAALEAAASAVEASEVELDTATKEWAAFEPRVQEATNSYQVHDRKRQEFEDGTLKTFQNLRDRDIAEGVEAEAASAGA